MFYVSFWLVSNIRKIVYFLKNLWLRYATCVSYIAKLIVNFLTNITKKGTVESTITILKVPRETSLGHFSKNTLTHS